MPHENDENQDEPTFTFRSNIFRVQVFDVPPETKVWTIGDNVWLVDNNAWAIIESDSGD